MTHGCLDTSIGELLEIDPALLHSFACVLITTIDSTRELGTAWIGREVLKDPGFRALGDGLLVPGPRLAALSSALRLFNGFDEIWCFDAEVNGAKPRHISIAPPPSLGESMPDLAVGEWMESTACSLALADGFGLNYLAKDKSLMRPFIAAAEIAQAGR